MTGRSVNTLIMGKIRERIWRSRAVLPEKEKTKKDSSRELKTEEGNSFQFLIGKTSFGHSAGDRPNRKINRNLSRIENIRP